MKLSLGGLLLLCAAGFAHADTLPAYQFQAVGQYAGPDVDLDDPRNAALAADPRLEMSDKAARLEKMVAAGLLLRQPDGSYRHTFPVIDRAAGTAFAAIDPALAERMAKMVEAHAKELRAAAPDLPALFLFGDIPFDRWQVRNVRSQFLGGYPPPRGGKEFYIADIESGVAPFYGHDEQKDGDLTLVTFGTVPVENAAKLLADYRTGKLRIPVIKRSAYAKLPALADSLTADLIALLEADRSVLEAAWRASPLSRTTSFREFGLWWYHFLYAEATDRLIADKMIDRPNAMMIVAED